MGLRLSILDQSVIAENETAIDAFNHTIELVQKAEALGYHRFWVSEHHNSDKLAGSVPEVLISHLLAKTNRIRIGSGGVMLQHYSPYKVAEIFNVLASLAPGRVDLGLGKAPGGLPLSTKALQEGLSEKTKELWEKLVDLKKFVFDNIEPHAPFYGLKAEPVPSNPPDLFLLGASASSAKLAGELGYSFVFAQFINSNKAILEEAFEVFSRLQERKKSEPISFILALSVIVADTDEEAKQLVTNSEIFKVHLESGKTVTVGSIEQAEIFAKQADENYRIEIQEASIIHGSKETVREKLLQIQDIYDLDEVIIITPIQNFEDRLKSYVLLSEAFSEISVLLK
ncbi:LLM class flavin-dependent oxidoreductase [Neobacillus ginsengisoli]|uniref:Luciferase family oxidoreductase group 1 n=1 Tax=Neobacillus ginsengisoli TaxID=904295 RepID=A0ABT9Y109_9BACI|nr:LLM class flavin-dependent oxidoreductase [Neobacillus ginsengisoli]MDQ0201514.1 luciferase family oxidoreductase group 1 [Neobacillus ginsengisoli]